MTATKSECTPIVVLDTNAVLDWLVFADPGMAALSAAVGRGSIRWVSTARMREELSRALQYPSLAGWKSDSAHVLTLFDRWSAPQPEPAPRSQGGLFCTDPDDQVFVELALIAPARWLVTQDRALLKLRRQARTRGLEILRPSDWRAP